MGFSLLLFVKLLLFIIFASFFWMISLLLYLLIFTYYYFSYFNDSDSCRSFSLLKAIAISFLLFFDISFKIEKERKPLLSLYFEEDNYIPSWKRDNYIWRAKRKVKYCYHNIGEINKITVHPIFSSYFGGTNNIFANYIRWRIKVWLSRRVILT